MLASAFAWHEFRVKNVKKGRDTKQYFCYVCGPRIVLYAMLFITPPVEPI